MMSENQNETLELKCENRQEWGCEHWCHLCDGKGWVPTEKGRDLLTFLRRHGFVQARESR